ncbi:olfactory receptor 4F21-like [Mastomys coucha]|uniref:olfactory receptor 4F21-like n=1 Tax=Mastomys coucha TaxID=35658 RepID=UPI001261F0D6|nr:olfactory receptor 4F21-like [Mastomys coucha]
MDQINETVVFEFVLLGLSSSWKSTIFLMSTFSLLYVSIILGNLFIVFLVITDSHLQSPMYFLLANLSLIDVGLSSTTVPKMISDLLREHKVISFHSCMTQICSIHIMGGVEMVLLIAMAFDRYTFFTPCMFLYVWPFPSSSIDKYLFIVDFAVTPALNPVIYTLRNKDMKEAIKKLSKQRCYIRIF